MSGGIAQNRFAPPRADVEDRPEDAGAMVAAPRGSRFLAILIDGVVPMILIMLILVAVAIPAYENYKQVNTPGIAPPTHGSRHLSTTWAWLGGVALLGYFVWSALLVYLYGQTFGKRMMGIRVVRTDGSRVPFSRFMLLRWLPLFIVGFVPLFNVIAALLDPLLIFRDSRQCLHDTIADTKVVTAETSVDATLNGDAKYAGTALRTISF
jgi:uncharacterized RDD family membrane protein YckC